MEIRYLLQVIGFCMWGQSPRAQGFAGTVPVFLQSFQPIDRPFVLNIAGPRESGAPGIQEMATEFLCQLLSVTQ